ncbi:substrate-binding periplasmic protein [Nocardioides sp. GXZ039]|uniref:substrate-binding periplasmic protein n=1 Tax=Nocardioides sp. GXZ039 TaxID=3136018 RepID=UPI0030F4AB2C
MPCSSSAAVLGAFALVLSLGACGSDDSSADTVDPDCQPAHDFQTAKEGVLTIGVVTSAPYSTLDPISKEWTGMDAEWAKAIAEKECLRIEASEVPGQDAIQKIQDGQIDLLSAGAFITPERGEVVGQTDPLYYQFTTIVSNDGLATVEDLEGKSVGVVGGSLYVDPLRKALGDIKEYPTTQEILADLQSGRIDAGVTASGEAFYQLDQGDYGDLEAVRIEESPKADTLADVYGTNMPYPKDNTAFGDALNADIAELREDGTAQEILVNWSQDDDTTLNGS